MKYKTSYTTIKLPTFLKLIQRKGSLKINNTINSK